MKSVGALTVAVLILAVRPLAAQRAQLTPADTGSPETVTLSSHVDDGFRVITIADRNHRIQIHPLSPVVCNDRNLQEALQQIEGAALDPAGCFLRADYGTMHSRHTLLFFAGHGYASDAAPALVLGFRSDGTPFKVLERNELDISEVQEEGGHGALIIGRPTLSEIFHASLNPGSHQAYLATYDPFEVYVVSANRRATYSLKRSELYNQRHYVWHGHGFQEDYAVVYNLPGHPQPFGLPAKKAEALVDHALAQKQ